jgi:Leucine-rich repeat (LRR) protein
MPAIRKQISTTGALAIPVILLQCGWKDEFGNVQAVPTIDGHDKAIADWVPMHDGYNRAREQVASSIKDRFGIVARTAGLADPFTARGQDPAGIRWIKKGEQFVQDAEGSLSDDQAATDPKVVQQHDDVTRLASHFEGTAARLDNAIGWRGIGKDAHRLADAVRISTLDVPGRIAGVYGAIVSLASFLEMDKRLRKDRNQTADPLDAEVERELSDLVSKAATWIRHFPTARGLDDALSKFQGRNLADADAAAIIRSASTQKVVSGADADSVASLLNADHRGGVPGDKAVAHGVLGVRNLLYRSGGLAVESSLDRPADAACSGSLLNQRVKIFLTEAKPQIIRFVADLPSDIKHAFERLMEGEAFELDVEDNPAVEASPEQEFDLKKARLLILEGRPLPASWAGSIRALDFGNRRLIDLTSLQGLTKLEKLKHLSVRVPDLEPLSGLTSLRDLDLTGIHNADLRPLRTLTGLRALDLSFSRANDPRPLAALTALQRLNLAGTRVTDVTALSVLIELIDLRLSYTAVTDVSPLAALSKLQTIGLSGTSVSDITPLVGLNALRHLNLRATNVIDVTSVASLASLQTLDLSDTDVVDVTSVASLASLQTLNLSGTDVVDVAPLGALTELRSLILSGTQVTDLTPLAALSKLRTLHLAHTPVSDITPLAGLTALRDINLANTQVADATIVSAFTELNFLRLSHTLVRDVTPLADLTKLQYLDLSDTPVSVVTPLTRLVNLWYIDLSKTQVRDISPLQSLPNLQNINWDGPKSLQSDS